MDEMEIASSASSRGPEILSNPVIIESILPALEHMNDILSLLLVSRQTYLLVNPLHPFSARKLSFADLAHVKNRHIIEFLYRPLGGVQINSRRRLLEDGRTVTVSGGLEKGYVGAWRFLNSIDLSGTGITTRLVKLLIAATAGGKIPGLLPDRSLDRAPTNEMEHDTYTSRTGLFSKEFESISGGAYRLLADQSLRLEKLCVTGCPGVEIGEINSFLKKILVVVTAPKRRELRLKATQQLAAAQQQQNGGNAGAATNNAGFAAIQQNPQVHAQAQAQAQQQNEDLSTVPSPLPATVEELEEFGLPCLSLRRLELANVAGLYVDPPEKYRGKKEWQYAKECPFGRNVGGLNSIAGCLGIDVDVLFCQGAGCATSFDNSRWRLSHAEGEETHFIYDDEFDVSTLASNPNNQTENLSQASGSSAAAGMAGDSSHHNNGSRNPRKTYHYPLPRLPGERILILDDGRVFRIPRHAIPAPPTAQQPQQQQNVPAPVAPAQLLAAPGLGQGQGNALNVGPGGGGGGAAVGGVAGGGGGIAPSNSQGWSAGQFLQDPAQYGLGAVGSAMPNTSALAHISQIAGLHGIQGLTAVADAASQIITGGGTGAPDDPATLGQQQGQPPLTPSPATDGVLSPNSSPDTPAAGPSATATAQPANTPGDVANASPGDGMNTALLDLMAAVQASTPPFGPTSADPSSPGGGIAPAATGVGGFLPQIPHNHQNIFAQSNFAQQQQPMAQANMHNHFHHPAIPPPPQQTHNQNQPAPGIGVSLGPRRRNNSPGGRTGSGAAAGRPGRRIAMLDGPRGLCEGCGREVWLCENCNRYWVVTCGGCASRV
ncbi:unnamed protein product [Tuber melanosporum]|uniref:(Perigord truffle) hypothetical protein n=1 Tax=Tuber melanosporum (strain Mel28) TaxID=656061 RepID=D5GQ05_TUBMM|nr:uncharacterized protein GSTUM_00012121001 [Tuber melanosporum]CAZ86598.1 unnamed protein product [Tuber melanosporum]